MNLFHRIEDAVAVVRTKGGIYRQLDVYRRGCDVFVRSGTGFVRVLNTRGDTSVPNVTCMELSAEGVHSSPAGKLTFKED